MGKKNKNVQHKKMAKHFMMDLINYLLVQYNFYPEKALDPKTEERFPSPFCPHVGESVMAISFVNRLNFRLRFENQLIPVTTDFLHQFVYSFCNEIFIQGYFDQFLVVYGFMIDLLLYLAIKHEYYFGETMIEISISVFENCLKDKFFRRGGWNELKRKCRPWWHAFRKMRTRNNHLTNPYYMLLHYNLTREYILLFNLDILTYEDHLDYGYADDLMAGQQTTDRCEQLCRRSRACRQRLTLVNSLEELKNIQISDSTRESSTEESSSSGSLVELSCNSSLEAFFSADSDESEMHNTDHTADLSHPHIY